MEKSFALHFEGDLENGIEAEDVASAISGFAFVSRLAGVMTYGDSQKLKFNVESISQGSLTIRFFLELAGVAQSLLPLLNTGSNSPSDMGAWIKAWFDLLKHLDGSPPSSVLKATNSPGSVQVQNVKGHKINIPINVYNTFNIYDLGRYAEQIGKPLKRNANKLEILVGRRKAANFNKREAASLRSVRRPETTLEQEVEVLLKVVAPVFEGNGLWRFSRGRNTITAAIGDPKFLAEVQSGRQSFRAGDILRVRLTSNQERIGDKIKEHHTIVEVMGQERTG